MREKQDKIILTGFRATGKTTVGKLLASELGLAFVDMDEELSGRHGPISELVARHGWPFFRQREKELLLELVPKTGLVIATGGGAILHSEAWQQLMQSGLVVWLWAPVAEIRQRLGLDAATASQRPTLTGGSVLGEVEELLQEREPLYRAGSHLRLDTTNTDPAELAGQIISHMRKHHGG